MSHVRLKSLGPLHNVGQRKEPQDSSIYTRSPASSCAVYSSGTDFTSRSKFNLLLAQRPRLHSRTLAGDRSTAKRSAKEQKSQRKSRSHRERADITENERKSQRSRDYRERAAITGNEQKPQKRSRYSGAGVGIAEKEQKLERIQKAVAA
jgi:hypothetical protein